LKDSHSNKTGEGPIKLDLDQINDLLSKTLIANLATTNSDGGIHIVPMWFKKIDNAIYIPTSSKTHKYKNLVQREYASVMIDISLSGLNLKGVLIQGKVHLIRKDKAKELNRMIHLKYVRKEAFDNSFVADYLSAGDDVTIKLDIEKIISWNLADSKAGKSLKEGDWARPLDLE
jgi:nitroimidazol reductase NimA-like FMN-containing flavoprotein (pyridoxamine 5'-phosphate oxidase superfamily)